MAAEPRSPHVTAHSELPVHVVLQLPMHFTLQLEVSLHAIAPPSTWILHVESMVQATVASAPSLKSQFELAVHVTLLPSPPFPLHWDVSLHVSVRASVVLPLHFAAEVHASEHAESPHSVLQSVPAAHVHAVSAHVQPVPVHVGALPSPPHAVEPSAINNAAM